MEWLAEKKQERMKGYTNIPGYYGGRHNTTH